MILIRRLSSEEMTDEERAKSLEETLHAVHDGTYKKRDYQDIVKALHKWYNIDWEIYKIDKEDKEELIPSFGDNNFVDSMHNIIKEYHPRLSVIVDKGNSMWIHYMDEACIKYDLNEVSDIQKLFKDLLILQDILQDNDSGAILLFDTIYTFIVENLNKCFETNRGYVNKERDFFINNFTAFMAMENNKCLHQNELYLTEILQLLKK